MVLLVCEGDIAKRAEIAASGDGFGAEEMNGHGFSYPTGYVCSVSESSETNFTLRKRRKPKGRLRHKNAAFLEHSTP